MKKTIWWLFILSLIVPHLALAQDLGPLSFTPPDTDLSINYLKVIFGTVPGVFAGDNPLIGNMMGIFNAGVLVLGGIVVTYTTLVSTMNTAHEGEVLGQKWASMWVPIRSAIGIGLLLPKTVGYSFVQVFVMWVIVQGVGLADAVWANALSTILDRGGLIIRPVEPPSPQVVKQMGQILKGVSCLYAVQDRLKQARTDAIKEERKAGGQGYFANNATVPPMVPDFVNSLSIPSQPINSSGYAVQPLPGDLSRVSEGYYEGYTGVCGNIAWAKTKYNQQTFGGLSDNPLSDEAMFNELAEARTLAVQESIWWMENGAQRGVTNFFDKEPDNRLMLYNKRANGAARFPVISGLTLGNAAVNYRTRLQPYLRKVKNRYQQSWRRGGFKSDKFAGDGWLIAGALYFELSKANTKVRNLVRDGNLQVNLSRDIKGQLKKTTLASSANGETYINQINTYLNGAGDKALRPYVLPTYINEARDYASNARNFNTGGSKIPFKVPKSKLGSGATEAMFAIYQVAYAVSQLMQAETNAANPLLVVAYLGSALMGTAIQMWLAIAITGMIASLGLSFVISFNLGIAGQVIMDALMSLFGPAMLSFFVSGAVMAFYIPFIPFILFIGGVLGWFLSVFETMLAAPLVALGVTAPEGHDAFGQASPAVLLLVSVFLRPTLMVFGFLGGLIISYVSIWVLNRGFGIAAGGVLKAAGLWAQMFYWVVFPVVYVSLVTYFLHQSFSLIYILPDKITRWIGGQGDSWGDVSRGGLQEAKGAVQGAAEPIAKGAEGGLQQGSKGLNKKAEAASKTIGARREAKEKKKQEKKAKKQAKLETGNK